MSFFEYVILFWCEIFILFGIFFVTLSYFLQFECINTLNELLLENVRVQLELPDGYKLLKEMPCPKLPYNEVGNVYILLEFPEEIACSVGNFGATLKFIVKDCDPITGIPDSDEGYNDEYMVKLPFRFVEVTTYEIF